MKRKRQHEKQQQQRSKRTKKQTNAILMRLLELMWATHMPPASTNQP